MSKPLETLLTDMQHYKTTSGHRGDLYEHSMWTEQYISQWAYGQGDYVSWMKGLSLREQYILALAGLLHDVGKAGDFDCSKFSKDESFSLKGDCIYYYVKLNHEKIGFNYVLHDIKDKNNYQGYKMFNGQPFNFKDLFQELQITEQEQKLIAILIGCHRKFMGVVLGQATVEQFGEELRQFAIDADFPVTNWSNLVHMAIIINIADFMATGHPFTSPKLSLVFGSARLCEPRSRFKNNAESAKKATDYLLGIKPKIESMHNSVLQLLTSKKVTNAEVA